MKILPDYEHEIVDRAIRRHKASSGDFPSRDACSIEAIDGSQFVILRNSHGEIGRYEIISHGDGVRLVQPNLAADAA